MSKTNFFRLIGKYFSFEQYRKLLGFLNHYVVGLFRRIDDHHIFLSGGGIAFSMILSTIPILLLVFALLGNIIDPTTIEENLSQLIYTIIPYPEYADFTTSAIMRRIPGVFQYSSTAFYLGMAGLFFTSTWLFSSMRTILNRVFGYNEAKGFLVGLVRDFGMVILLILLVLVSTFVLPTINIFIKATESIEFLQNFRVDSLIHTIFSFTSILVVLLLFFLFYSLIPYAKLDKKVTFVGALWATILWEIARLVFGYYVQTFLQSNKFYEAFLLILVLLFWLFYASILFIIGAEIAQLYRERLEKKAIVT
ncbi:MAG: YihY/virulence factor BrkB family protein [Melioribacteraceae bacterium]|nr:YihY/virulence factor BrkB family protein [Melioribacteraceae bacterium]